MASPSLNTRELKRAVRAITKTMSPDIGPLDTDPAFYGAKLALHRRFRRTAAMFEIAEGTVTAVSRDCRRTFVVAL